MTVLGLTDWASGPRLSCEDTLSVQPTAIGLLTCGVLCPPQRLHHGPCSRIVLQSNVPTDNAAAVLPGSIPLQ